jgi:predicted acetyltransferase
VRTVTDYGVPRDQDERKALASILSQSFAAPAEDVLKRFEMFPDIPRVVRTDGRVAGGLWLIPMAQWFGGRSVPMGGVAAVGVPPESRGTGIALEMMVASLAELREQGTPLSTLYPAAQTLYRKAGYEQAGGRYSVAVPGKVLHMKDRALTMRAATEDDRPAIKEVHRAYAAPLAGQLDRGDYCWYRVFNTRKEPTQGYVVEEDGGLTGYIFLTREPTHGHGFYDVNITNMVATTPAAGRRLLTFLADHRSMTESFNWFAGQGDPMLALMLEQSYAMKLGMFCMTRIVHVPAALEARGYPIGLEAELHLEIHDENLPANDGRFILEISGGRGKVREGGEARLRLHVRGLACVYTGFLAPRGAAAAGLAEGDEAEMALATTAFAGPTPWMSDMF